jgi:hypothetical protein
MNKNGRDYSKEAQAIISQKNNFYKKLKSFLRQVVLKKNK